MKHYCIVQKRGSKRWLEESYMEVGKWCVWGLPVVICNQKLEMNTTFHSIYVYRSSTGAVQSNKETEAPYPPLQAEKALYPSHQAEEAP